MIRPLFFAAVLLSTTCAAFAANPSPHFHAVQLDTPLGPSMGGLGNALGDASNLTVALPGSANSRTLSALLSDNYNLLDDGAKFDGFQFSDTVTVSGTALSILGTWFSASQVGKLIVIPGAGASGAPLTTTIAAFIGATSVTLAAAAPTALAAYATTLTIGTDDTAAWNTALARGGIVRVPQGMSCVSASLSTPVGASIWLQGSGKNISILMQTNMSANGIKFQPNLSGICMASQLSVRAAVAWNMAGSSGAGLWLLKGNNNCGFEDCEVKSFDTCYRIDSSWNGRFFNLDGMNFQTAGLLIPTSAAPGGSNTFRSCYMTIVGGFTGSTASSAGYLVQVSGGETFDDCQCTAAYNGFVVRPISGQQVAYLFFANCVMDTTVANAWVFDGTNGNIISTRGSQLWGAYSGGNGITLTGNPVTPSGGAQTTGIDDFHVVNGDFRQNGQNGLVLAGGTNVRFDSCDFAANSMSALDAFDGISISNGVSLYSFLFCRSGNFGAGNGLTYQRYGMSINGSGTPTGQVIGCDFTQNHNGYMSISVNTNTLVMAYNMPLDSALVNVSQSIQLSGSTNGVVAAGSTVYLGQNGQQANMADGVFVLAGGYINGVFITTDAAPGAGHSFTYQAYVNGVAVASASVCSGSSTSAYINIADYIGSNALLTLQIVTSAGAAAARHRMNASYIP